MAARGEERFTDGLVAAAFSVMLQRQVITEQEYEERRHEPEFSKVEELKYEDLSEAVYASATSSVGDVLRESGEKINIYLSNFSGRKICLEVGKDSYVEVLRPLCMEKLGICLPDGDNMVLIYGGTYLRNGHRLSEYNVSLTLSRFHCSHACVKH